MTTRGRAAARLAGMIDSDGRFKRGGVMAIEAIRRCHLVIRLVRLAHGTEDTAVVTGHALLARHLRASMVEGAAGKRREGGRVALMATDAITRGRYVVTRMSGCIRPIVTVCAGVFPVVYSTRIQGRVVEARGKAAAGLMAVQAGIRRCRVRPALADGFHRIASGMTGHARLGFYGRILMVDRIGLQEITRRGVTGIAIPPIRIHRGMRRVRGMAPGTIDRIIVGTDVARPATGGIGRVHRIHKRVSLGITAHTRAINARTIGFVRMAGAAIRTGGEDVTRRLRDHEGGVVSLAIVARAAVFANTRRRMVEGRHGETGVHGAVTDQTVCPDCCCRRHVRQ